MKIWHNNKELPKIYKELIYFTKEDELGDTYFQKRLGCLVLVEGETNRLVYRDEISWRRFSPSAVVKWAYMADLIALADSIEMSEQ